MEKKKPTVLPGLVNIDTKPKVLAGIKKAADDFIGSALPIMKYFGNVKPSRNERIIKPDMTSSGKITKQDLPIIREVLQPGFSGNFRTNYTPPSTFDANNDPLTDAMIAATGETDATQISAYNTLAERLRGTGTTNGTDFITDDLIHVFNPISSTSLAAAAYNFIDPSTFQAIWYNSPTHSSSGVVGNGTTQYGDTTFTPSTSGSLNDFGLTIYVSTNVAVSSVDMGARVATTSFVQLNSYFSGAAQGIVNTNAVGFTSAANANSIGVYTAVRRTSTDTELYKDGVSIDTKVDTSVSLPTGNLYVLGRNLIGTGAEQFTTRRLSTYVIHKGLTDNQATDLYDAITDYNTALSR